MEIFIVWFILAIIIAVWASGRGHSGFGMFVVSLLLSPLIGFLIEAVRGKNVAVTEATAVASGTMKKCPACAELVKAEAVKCRYCGEALSIEAPDVPPDDRRRDLPY